METINLDGESNLKIKKGLEQTKELEQLLGTFMVSLRRELCTLYQQYIDMCWSACHVIALAVLSWIGGSSQ